MGKNSFIKKKILKKNTNLEFCKIVLITKECRSLNEKYIITPNLFFYENFFYSISYSNLNYLRKEYCYKPNGDLKNFI
jgi:hypothetical protein